MRKLPPNFLPSFAGRPGTGAVRCAKYTHGSHTCVPLEYRTRFWPTKPAPIQSSRFMPRVIGPAHIQHRPSTATHASTGGAAMWP